ncbi:helix-turn-helix domain-containing protein [Chelativorans sp. Marseille-P2723]|uniref:helix-turn-helix domain-containing protein n=1 Tax=Chelativorans sp. Marseille-P2723 TaxID=2709133 RepID=UPI00156F5FC1|nr:helix-turn-helix domain-containing protein [Chelativorans sp. Marseille-P2723]
MSRGPVKSAVRVLEILRLFSEQRRELNQKDIIGSLNYPQSSTTFLLKSMVDTGFLSFDRKRRTYLPTPEVYRIGEWLEHLGYEHMFRESVLTAMMEDLRANTGQTVSLTTQNDIFVQWHRIVGDVLPSTQRVSEGGSLPLTWSAYGWLLLSRETDVHIDRIVRLIKARETDPAHKFDVAEMTAKIREVRTKNVFYMVNQRLSGAAACAALLPVKIAGRNVAVGIGGDRSEIGPQRDKIMQNLTDTLAAFRSELISTFCEEHSLAIAA